MDYKHSCVIDANFFYKTFVLVLLVENQGHQQEEKVQYYELQEGEQLIDTAPPALRPHAGASGFVKAKWDGSWIEGATEEEIAAWEEEHPAPELPDPPDPSGGDYVTYRELADAIREGVNAV